MPKHLPASLFLFSVLLVTLSAPVFAIDNVTTSPTAAPKLKITNLKEPSGSALPRTTRVTANRLNFQAKLATIKDVAKRNVVERIDARMSLVNKNRTNELLVNLNAVSAILERVAARAAVAKSTGKETLAVDSAVAAARSKITAAHDLIVAQAAKDYVMTINSNASLKSDVSTTVRSLEIDIKATREAVVAAREAVRAAIQALAKVL